MILCNIKIYHIIFNLNKRHLSFKPGSHFRTSPCSCLHLLTGEQTVLESIDDDLLAAFHFDFDIWLAETPGPKSTNSNWVLLT